MTQRSKLVLAASAFALATCLTGGAARAQELRGDKAIFFTFSQPVMLPQVTLPAGKYLFRLADTQTTRTVVQVYNEDQTKLLGMMITLPALRATATDDPQVQFMEATEGSAMPIRSYYFAGSTSGWEFIYPRKQAMDIAKNSKQPVLTTAQDVSNDSMSSAALARVDASGQQTAVNGANNDNGAQANAGASNSSGSSASASANSAQAGSTPSSGSSSAAGQSPSASSATPSASSATPGANSNTAMSQSANANQTSVRTRLPRTASATPGVALAGLVALVAALGLGVARRRLS